MKRVVFLALTGILLYGCSSSTPKTEASAAAPEQNQVVITNDMENAAAMIPSWSNEKTVVKMEAGKAHTGEFASKFGDGNEYSYAYAEFFKNLNSKLPKTVTIHGWVSSPDPSEHLGIVMDINENNVTKKWAAWPLKSTVKGPDTWYEFTAIFPIDVPIQPNYQIKLFGNSGNKLSYLDDLTITFNY